MSVRWLDRYTGSVWHRIMMLFRGLFGLIIAVPLLCFTLFIGVLEIGNRFMDTILEEDSESYDG